MKNSKQKIKEEIYELIKKGVEICSDELNRHNSVKTVTKKTTKKTQTKEPENEEQKMSFG